MIFKKPASRFLLWYIRVFAKLQLKKIHPVVIGIGGASGKSSLVALVSIALSQKYKVKQSKGKNSETGIPLDILGIKLLNYDFFDWLGVIFLAPFKLATNWQKYDAYVAEMGIDSPDEPKNMSYLLKIVTANIATLTNISLEHSQYFDVLVKEEDEKVREEKILSLTSAQESLLLLNLKEFGTAVVNLDDENIKNLIPKIKSRKVTVSTKDKSADFFASKFEASLENTSFEVTYLGEHYQISLSYPLPKHYVLSILQTLAIAFSMGISIKDAISQIEANFSLPPGRLSIFEGIKGVTIIDSSYNNATLAPILDILDFLKTVSENRRKVAILGDMRELGSMSKKLHEAIAKKILETTDAVILIGPMMAEYVVPILKASSHNFKSFPTFSKAKSEILEFVKAKDVVLVKGSQNTLFLERVVEMLLKNKEDVGRLARRGSFWDKKRKETP